MAWTTATTRSSGFLVTAAVWNSEHVGNMNWLKEVSYTAFTSNVSVTATTEGTANTVVTAPAHTFEAVPYLIEFFSPSVRADSAAANRSLTLVLLDSTTVLGWWGVFVTPAASTSNSAAFLQHRLTPTAASHTYNVRAFVNAGTGLVRANTGGAGVDLPGFIRITRVPV